MARNSFLSALYGDPDPTHPAPAPADATAVSTPTLQLLQRGITNQQAAAYIPRVSPALHRNVTPAAYTGHQQELLNALRDMASTRPIPSDNLGQYEKGYTPSRDDAWRMYLGMPQANNTFQVSQHRPPDSAPGEVYYSIPSMQYAVPQDARGMKQMQQFVAELAQQKAQGGANYKMMYDPSVMGNYRLGHDVDPSNGQPYLWYQDVWNLEPGREGHSSAATEPGVYGKVLNAGASAIGRPLRIYGRVYYDPKTYQTVNPPVPSVVARSLTPAKK